MSPAGFVIEHVDETGSTNSDLLARVQAALPSGEIAFAPCLLVAGRQTAGRGRHGRRWEAARGASLTFSLAWPFARTLDLSGLSLAVGVALAEALDLTLPCRIGLKWPNDLWLTDPSGGRKLGGVLIETAPYGADRVAVIGIGVNVHAFAVDEAASGLACLDELDADASPDSVLDRVVAPLSAALRSFERDGFAVFAERFAARDVLRGLPVRIDTPGGAAGVATGVSNDGELLVRTAGGVVAVRSGEARLLRLPASTTFAAATC